MLERHRLPQNEVRSDIFLLRMIILIALCIFALTGVAMAEPVAKIGDVEYNSLDEAFSVVTTNGGTLTILQDAPWINDITITKDVVIEGNNRIISAGSDASISVLGTGSLTMNETVFDGGTSEISGFKESFISITGSGKVLFQNSIIQNRNIGGNNTFGVVFQIDGPEASLIMANSKIINCKVGLSGGSESVGAIGIGVDGGHLTINGGEISNCGTTLESGDYYGGAIVAFPYYSKGYISISDTVIKNNHSVYGGGISLAYDCDFSINNVSFKENISEEYGGALYIEGSSEENKLPSGSVEGCLLADNSGRYGGGLYINTCNISVKDCILSNNDAVKGGGLFNDSSAISFSGKNTICNNAASSCGADIFNNKGSITLPSASAMNETFHDKRFIIDGWYDDTQGNRWSEDGTGNEYLGDTYTITEGKGIIAAYTLYDEIQVTKTWEDENDALGKRPNSLTFTLTDLSGTPVKLRTYDAASKTWIPGSEDAKITLNASDFSGNVWTGTIGPLLLHDYSDPSKYLLKEDLTGIYYKLQPGDPTITYIPDKTGGTAVSDSGVFNASFTNHGPVTVSIIKIWDDVNNKDQIRPSALNTQLVIGSTPQADVDGYTVFTLNEDPTTHTWTKTITLPAGDYTNLQATEGRATDYTQTKYNKSISSDGTITFLFVNTHTLKPAATDTIANESMVNIVYQAAKTWSGSNPVGDKKLPRPEITVSLYDGEEKVDSVVIQKDAAGDPVTVTFPKPHPKYKDNNSDEVIVYTIKEEVTDPEWVKVDDNEWYSLDGMGKYTGSVTDVTAEEVGSAIPYGNVTASAENTYHTLQDITSIDVTKQWKDHGNENGVRPDTLTLGLFAPGAATPVKKETLTGESTAESWTGTFTDLPIYDSTGAAIDYSIYIIKESYDAGSTWVEDGQEYTITKDGKDYTYDYSIVK